MAPSQETMNSDLGKTFDLPYNNGTCMLCVRITTCS